MPLDLKNATPFRGLQENELRVLAEKASLRGYPRNTIVVSEGEYSQSLYVILSGKVKVYVSDENGKELTLDIKGPGEYFGEMVLDEGPRSASVMTVEPCQFAIISIENFKQALLEHPQLALQVIKNLIRMARGLDENVKNLAMLDVYGRVSRLLLDLAVHGPDGYVIPEKLTQQDLADRVGTSREVVNRVLRDLAAGGYIRIEDRKIAIIKRLPSRI